MTSTPWAPAHFLFHEGDRIGLASVHGQRGAEPSGEVKFDVIDVDRDHVEAHGLGVLDRQMAETADA